MLNLILRNIKMIYRTIKSLLLRPLMMFKNKFMMLFNISKLLNKLTKFLTSLLAKLKLKPEKRNDYVDAGRVFIAKSLIAIVLVLIIAVPVLIYYFAWPWLVSMFFTAKLYEGQPKIVEYNGKVEIYYEEELKNLMFKGRLSNGKYINIGEAFYKNNMPMYSGNYLDGKYDGKGTWYSEDAKQYYKGDFVGGKKTGKGQIFQAGKLFYDGDMKDDKKAGSGKQYYADGSVAYEGAFTEDVYEGTGTENYEGGKVKFKGTFKGGLYSDKGSMYDKQETMIYNGNFERGLFNGDGRYFSKDGKLAYDGNFINGLFDGKGKLYKKGTLFYEGSFLAGMMSGTGTLTDDYSGLKYTGLFENNDIAYGKLFNMKVGDIYTAFVNGLTEDISFTDNFYLSNQTYGLVLKLVYANDKDPAKLNNVYMLPHEGSPTILKGIEELKLPGSYTVGETGVGVIYEDIAYFLGLEPGKILNYYKAEYVGYGVCYWTNPETGSVLMMEYYPVVKSPTADGKKGQEEKPKGGSRGETNGETNGEANGEANGDTNGDTNGETSKGNNSQKNEKYLKDLGLDLKDFASLGF